MTFPTLSDVTLASSITKAVLFCAAVDMEVVILFG